MFRHLSPMERRLCWAYEDWNWYQMKQAAVNQMRKIVYDVVDKGSKNDKNESSTKESPNDRNESSPPWDPDNDAYRCL
jgi:hypothetical protein